MAEKPSEMLPKKIKPSNMKIGSCRCVEGCGDRSGGVRWLPGVTQAYKYWGFGHLVRPQLKCLNLSFIFFKSREYNPQEQEMAFCSTCLHFHDFLIPSSCFFIRLFFILFCLKASLLSLRLIYLLLQLSDNFYRMLIILCA